MILGDNLLCKISRSAHRQISLTEKLPMNICLGNLVREVEGLEVYAGDPDRDCLDLVINCYQNGVIVERHHY